MPGNMTKYSKTRVIGYYHSIKKAQQTFTKEGTRQKVGLLVAQMCLESLNYSNAQYYCQVSFI